MKNYFRIQEPGISIEEMKAHQTLVDVDDNGEEIYEAGVSCCLSPSGYDGGSCFGGAWDAADENWEIVIFEGHIVSQLYDGYVVEPVQEVARFTKSEWRTKIEDMSAWEYEKWQ